MPNLFSSAKIINHLLNADLIHTQLTKMLGNKICKGYVLSDYYSGSTGLHCVIVEQMAYSEEEYWVIISWNEIDRWVEKESNRQFEVSEAFQKIKEAYSKAVGY